MKRQIWACLLLAGSLTAQAQDYFTIEGNVTNVKDGTILNLFRIDGRVGSSIAVDTIRNGHFNFKARTLGNDMEKFDMMGRSEEFPSMGLKLWIRPGSHLNIKGQNTLIYTWQVDSDIEEQQLHQAYINDSRELWDEYQENNLKEEAYYPALRNSETSETEKKAIRNQLDSLDQESDKIRIRIDANIINRMKQSPVNDIWIEKLEGLAMSVGYRKDYPYKNEVIALYNRLTEAEKNTGRGKTIRTDLYPPTVVNAGDEMADADLYDLDGKVHRLTDYKGKHILLDFWSRGCGPCIMALPEMKEIAEKYKDYLTVVSLSSDSEKGWKEASAQHNMTWENLNDLEGTNGLYAKYGVRGIPNYVLISPEGRIIEKWSGYGKFSLKLKLRRLLDSSKNAMSLGEENGCKVVNYPTVKKTNTDIHEIRQVVLTDSCTIVRIRGYYIPEYWIQMAKNIQLIADNGTVCPILRTEGIPLGEHFFMPKSGEADYTLYFAPLPDGTRFFDMIEPEGSRPDRMEGIALTLPDA